MMCSCSQCCNFFSNADANSNSAFSATLCLILESMRLEETTLYNGSDPDNNINELFDVLAKRCHGRVVNATKLMRHMHAKKFLGTDECMTELLDPSRTVSLNLKNSLIHFLKYHN